MLVNPDLLTSLDNCERWGKYSLTRQRKPLRPLDAMYRCIYGALMSDSKDKGETAGEMFVRLSRDRGIDGNFIKQYDACLHLACLCDIITAHLSTKYHFLPLPVAKLDGHHWESRVAQVDGELHRVCLVSDWSQDRLRSESLCWYALGEQCTYDLPMTMHVCLIGANRSDKRHSPWTKALLHPRGNLMPRFRKKTGGQPFNSNWKPIWREERDEIDRSMWLKGMANDGVLDECYQIVRLPKPTEERRAEILKVVNDRALSLSSIHGLGAMSISNCWWPSPCPFSISCWQGKSVEDGENFLPA